MTQKGDFMRLLLILSEHQNEVIRVFTDYYCSLRGENPIMTGLVC